MDVQLVKRFNGTNVYILEAFRLPDKIFNFGWYVSYWKPASGLQMFKNCVMIKLVTNLGLLINE